MPYDLNACGLVTICGLRVNYNADSHFVCFQNTNEINHYTSAGGSSTMYLNWVGGDVNIARSAIYAKSAGNVGIGTTSPSTPLQIRDNTIAAGGSGLSVFGYDGAVEFTTTRAESPANAAIYLYNRPTSGTNGTGTGISFRASSTNTADRPQGGFYSSWTDSTDATRTSKFFFDLVNSGTYATRMTLLGNGNLGIGTTVACTRLSVRCSTGGVKIDLLSLTTTDGAGSQPTIRFDTIEANCNVLGRISVCDVAPYAGTMIFETSAAKAAGSTTTTEVMRLVGTTGNVGIGTTSPSQRLHVAGTSLFTDTMNFELGKISWNSTRFVITSCGTANIAFATDNFTDRMTIQCGTGNVGIGTTSPNTPLHIVAGSSDGVPILRICATTSPSLFNWAGSIMSPYLCSGRNFVLLIGQEQSTKNSGYIGYNHTGTAGSNSNFLTFGHYGSDNLMNLMADGKLGIGTTSPASRLEVCSAGVGDASNVRITSTTCYGAYVVYNGSSLRASLGYGDDGNIFSGALNQSMAIRSENSMHLGANGNCLIMTLISGKVGVGTTSPSYKLHVNGTFYAAGSSIKYKEGICNYDTDSCLFMCLKPVAYQYKDEFKHLGKELKSDIQIGLIAEHVADIMPELAVLVNEEDEKVVRNVDYEKLSIVLLAEVQKLRKEVDALKS